KHVSEQEYLSFHTKFNRFFCFLTLISAAFLTLNPIAPNCGSYFGNLRKKALLMISWHGQAARLTALGRSKGRFG
ncbi:MAG: hypothetical protein J5584_07950, partial [Clostridia bacterium]|nr:hypothetical protein [Clostridia bacterium]